MHTISCCGKTYMVDASGLLTDPGQWDENFAIAMASRLNIQDGLTAKHWEIIHFIRDTFERTGRCPLVYEVCRAAGLKATEFKKLFPTGYLRGACLLAGITYRDQVTDLSGRPGAITDIRPGRKLRFTEKIYVVDESGFLVDPVQWDAQFAVGKAEEMKMKDGLTPKHWQVIHYLRCAWFEQNRIPTVFDCCDENSLSLEELEALFPDGYHRGAVKLSGLRVK